ncbi:hypothetical protein WN943_027285 [Citrus x changshan-huyou]
MEYGDAMEVEVEATATPSSSSPLDLHSLRSEPFQSLLLWLSFPLHRPLRHLSTHQRSHRVGHGPIVETPPIQIQTLKGSLKSRKRTDL